MSIISKGTKILKKLPKIKKNTFKNNNKKNRKRWVISGYCVSLNSEYNCPIKR